MPPSAIASNIPAGNVTQVRGYRYEAQALDGKRITGVIEASGPEWVAQQLGLLQLRLIRLDPIAPASTEPTAATAGETCNPADKSSQAPGRGRALRGVDFIAFNQQLAQLAKAGLPIESGLRLIAKDMRSGKLAQTVRLIADELDNGTPIEQAFDKYRSRFPSLYGQLLGAGVRSGDLAGVLLGFSVEMELQQRLRSTLWRALSYPLTVLAALTVVLLLLSIFVLPRFQDLYHGFSVGQVTFYTRSFSSYTRETRPIVPPEMPLPTQILFAVGWAIPYLAAVLLVAIVLAPLVWQVLRRSGRDRQVIDAFVLRLPFVGRPLRLCLIARWCNALRIGVSAGLPLPQAIALAGDSVRSPRLKADGQILTSRLEHGLQLANPISPDGPAQGNPASDLSILPATVPVALELASGHNDLPGTLQSLTDLYERQAEVRIQSIPAILTPLMVVVVACWIGFVMLALITPFVRLLDFLR